MASCKLSDLAQHSQFKTYRPPLPDAEGSFRDREKQVPAHKFIYTPPR